MIPNSLLRSIAPLCIGLTGVLLAGCGSGEDSATGVDGSSGGAALYDANCAACHGSDLRGTSKGPSHLSIVYEPNHHGDEAFRSAIANGSAQHHWSFGDMPPVPGLDAGEVDAIIAYVRDVQAGEGFER